MTPSTGSALRDGVDLCQLVRRKGEVQPTAWVNTPKSSRPIAVRDGFLQGTCEAAVAFALALRLLSAEFEDEMRKQGSQFATEPEYWASVDDITTATTAKCHEQNQRDARETRSGAQERQMPNSRKSQDPRGNDALREVDTECPHDFGHGQ